MSKIVTGSAFLSLPSSPETWLIEPLLPSSGAMLLYGDPKVGKSFAALQLAHAVATGESWLGFPCRKARVCYAQLDTPRNVWQKRITTLASVGAINDLDNLWFTDRELMETWPFDILNPAHLIMFREELQALKPDMVIMDTLRESHSADENDSTEMQEAIAALVAATQPAALILISHSRKPSQDEGYSLMNDNRGSSYVVGRMDAIVRFTPKSARVSGRTIEEHSLDLERQDSGFWDVSASEADHLIHGLLLDPSAPSIRQKAKILSGQIGKSESASRALIRRFIAAHPHLRVD
jgi:RecA-family ATPase